MDNSAKFLSRSLYETTVGKERAEVSLTTISNTPFLYVPIMVFFEPIFTPIMSLLHINKKTKNEYITIPDDEFASFEKTNNNNDSEVKKDEEKKADPEEEKKNV